MTAPYRPPRLGQISEAVAGPIASRIVAEAAPKLRGLVQEERARVARALRDGLPYAGLAAAGALATAFLAPPGAPRLAGYAAALLAGGAGAWSAAAALSEAEAGPAPGAPIPVVQPVVDAAARRVAEELGPRIGALLAEERARAAEAGKAGLPYFAASALAAVGTAVLAPAGRADVKLAGYGASALAFVLGLWRVLDEESRP